MSTIKNIYMIWDKQQETLIGSPWITTKDGAAIRDFTEMCGNTQLVLGQHPEDFELWKLGQIDVESGSIHAGDLTIGNDGRHRIFTGKLILDAKERDDRTQPPLRAS